MIFRLPNILISSCALLATVLVCSAGPQSIYAPVVTNAANQKIVLPAGLPDPLEKFNRTMWAFNKGLLIHVLKPSAKVYRSVVGKPVRMAIGNLGTNLTYPDRLLNNMIQGRWRGARDETYRFLANSSAGFGGLFDVATEWGVPRSPADFGQTFGRWGWKPSLYLMLPFFGPTDDRDAVGLAADSAANPLDYLAPYSSVLDDPFTYFAPYTYFTFFDNFNNVSDSVDDYVRFVEAETDPYAELSYAFTFIQANRVADFHVKGKQDESTLETLESVFFTYSDPEFPFKGQTESVLIPATGRRLKFTLWMQPGRAPVVYIIPGLGSHRLSETSLALAELAYKDGFSVIAVSSPFNKDFMDAASTVALPGYLPVDSHDMLVALTEIGHHVAKQHPERLGDRALMGYSMGAFNTLYIAAAERTNSNDLIHFDRFVGINTPVRLLNGVSKLDEFYQAPLGWPANERTDDIENTFLKVAALSQRKLSPQMSLPFSAIESKFLIGVTFRQILRDIIFDTQERHNMGILQHPIVPKRRTELYNEIMQYSYQDYYAKFAVPYYQNMGMTNATGTLAQGGDLRTYQTGLRQNPNVRVMVNENDFLLEAVDLDWLRATVPPGDLKVFKEGGHLGNLFNPNVQQTILDDLSGLK